MSKHALIFQGGWDGHEPKKTAELFAEDLTAAGYAVTVDSDMNRLADVKALEKYNLIVPCWTMGKMTHEQASGLQAAVKEHGIGLAGTHGGMGDAFRGDLNYEWMVGGMFVGHPHVGEYEVRRTNAKHELSALIPEKFSYNSEQYYMMTDPGITVLAESTYYYDGRYSTMPVVWVKTWGKGRVFYNSLGHKPQEFIDYPEVRKFTVAGMLWAAKKPEAAK